MVPLIFKANGKVPEVQGIERDECRRFVLNEQFELAEKSKK